LQYIAGYTYYLPGPVNIGIYAHGNGKCTVIDTGIDKDSGRRILKALANANLQLEQIINTHAHADHFGGNAFLVARTEAEVWAPVFEAQIIQAPQLEPFYLYSAWPIGQLQTKFLQAPPSQVNKIITVQDKTPEGLSFLELPGHSPAQIGVITPDGVLFCADAYFSEETLTNYYLPYFIDIPRAKQTLRMLLTEPCYRYILPAHGKLAQNPEKLLRLNLSRLNEIDELIWENLAQPHTREDLLAKLISEKNLPTNPAQYYLYYSSIGAHLAGMAAEGKIGFSYTRGYMYWQQI
jgi:glyoxylase-like metal-dependent hydrolase (beta-lactamase superfamily II)